MRRLPPLVVALVAALGWAAGCGAPPELRQPPALPSPPPATPTAGAPSATPPHPPASPPPDTPSPTPSPSPTPRFPAENAVGCGGEPAPDEIVAVLRRAGLLPATATATVSHGPVCADDWQYAVVSVTDRDPLQVLTRGEPGTLTLVTAGTDVCTVEVRVSAPPGIRTAAGCVG